MIMKRILPISLKKQFDLKIFLSGFFGNSILSIALTYLGEKLNVDIYLAAIVVFVGRMFTNLAIIRRHYIDKWVNAIETKKAKKQEKKEESVEEWKKRQEKEAKDYINFPMNKEEYEKFLAENSDSEDIINILDDEMTKMMIAKMQATMRIKVYDVDNLDCS